MHGVLPSKRLLILLFFLRNYRYFVAMVWKTSTVEQSIPTCVRRIHAHVYTLQAHAFTKACLHLH